MIDSCIIIAAYLNRCLYIFINSLKDYEFGNDFGVLLKMATRGNEMWSDEKK